MKIARDPLIHFVVLGAALFGLVTLTGGENTRAPEDIVVTAGQIASLQAIFAKTWQRSPTPAEIESLVAEYVRDEILYREALAMGLDKDDALIRRRLRQKFEFVTDVASEAEPTDAELQAYVAEHPDWFRGEPRFSFSHVFFSADNPVAGDSSDLDRLRQGLQDGSLVEAETGDTFLPGFDFQALARTDTLSFFGEPFAASLDSAALDRWVGPIASPYGTHLVRLTARIGPEDMPFERARAIARRELMNERRIAAGDALYEELRQRYVVTVEPAPSEATDPPLVQAAR